ncbi:hypothetical protein GCM10023175_15080 [Pseudonocardia xishanensis]|uniref:Uncharacterized protein n=1 Tax=Pseudonocardia xishanensis TaxID=630995 RepID=A0ABP8RKK5_9PSEU
MTEESCFHSPAGAEVDRYTAAGPASTTSSTATHTARAPAWDALSVVLSTARDVKDAPLAGYGS